MKFIESLINPSLHCEDTVFYLLKNLNIDFTKSTLQKELIEHPDYPSMAAIADVVGISYDIASSPLKITRQNIQAEPEIKTPFIAQIKGERLIHSVFAVVTDISNESVKLYRPDKKKVETLSIKNFDNIYTGTILAIRKGNREEEQNYATNLKKEKETNFLNKISAFSLPTITVIACIVMLYNSGISSIPLIFFTLFTLAGCIISTILLWHEIDEYNPVIQQFCRGGKKINCSAILDSKASKIFGISWSSIGFVYFMGMLLSILTSGGNSNILTVLCWINLIALPYIVFSIYYQWKVAKQWCTLCLIVQTILLLQFVTALAGDFHNPSTFLILSSLDLLKILTPFVFVFTTILILKPSLEKAKLGKTKSIDLQRLKHNPQVFEALLKKQKQIEGPMRDLGITFGNPHGIFKLIKVCNPYCGPCSRAHTILETLIEDNNEIGIQLIFTATEKEEDIARIPVSHLLAIAAKNNMDYTKKALNDWYNPPIKDYRTFSSKYPMNGELNLQMNKIKDMSQWCDATGINYTPTIFICLNTNSENPTFHQLPEIYTAADLKYFLTM